MTPSPAPVDVSSGSPPDRWSASQVNLSIQCWRRYQRRYLKHWPDPPSEAAVRGTIVHRAGELTHPQAWDDKATLRAHLQAAYAEEAAKADNAQVIASEDRGELLARSWQGLQRIARYMLTEQPKILHRERRVEFDIDGVPVVAVIDVEEEVAEGPRPLDYKSGAFKADHVDEKYVQGGIYQAALATDVPARFLFLAHDEPVAFDIPHGWRHKASVAVVRADTERRRLLHEAGDGDWPANPGPLCGWCPYVMTCRPGLDWLAEVLPTVKIRSGMHAAPAVAAINATPPAELADLYAKAAA